MRVKIPQIMVPIEEFPVIFEDDYIHKAAEVIVDIYKSKDSTWRGYESLHVIDRNQNSVGLVTLRSILKAVSPARESAPTRKKHYFPIKATAAESPVRVKEIMRKLDSGFVRVTDDVDRAIRIILDKNFNYVPVLNESALVGMIRAIDLFWFLGEII